MADHPTPDCDEHPACTCAGEWPAFVNCGAHDWGDANGESRRVNNIPFDLFDFDLDRWFDARDCDGTPEDANAGLGDFDAQACILGAPSFVQPHPRGPWNLMFDADAVNDCDGAGRAS